MTAGAYQSQRLPVRPSSLPVRSSRICSRPSSALHAADLELAPISSQLQSHATQLHVFRSYADTHAVGNGRVRVEFRAPHVNVAKAVVATDTRGTRNTQSDSARVGRERGRSENAPLRSVRNAAKEERPLRATSREKHSATGVLLQPYRYTPPAAAKYYLWDNTPIGPPHALNPDTVCPHSVLVQPQAIRALLAATAGPGFPGSTPLPGVTLLGFFIGRSAPLDIRLARASDHLQHEQRFLVLDRYDPGKRVGDGAVGGLEPTFVAKADVVLPIIRVLANEQINRDAARYAYFLEAFKMHVRDVATPSQTPAWITVTYNDEFRINGMRFTNIIPDIKMIMSPIHPLRVVPSAAALELKRPRADRQSNFGFVAIDQARQLLPLLATDPDVCRVPLVGIWATGGADLSIRSTSIRDACARFISNGTTIRKLETGKNTMLAVLATCAQEDGKPSMDFYECAYEVGKEIVAVFSMEGTPPGDSGAWQNLNAGGPLRFDDLRRKAIRDESPLCDAIELVMGVIGLERTPPSIELSLPAKTPLPDQVEVPVNGAGSHPDGSAIEEQKEEPERTKPEVEKMPCEPAPEEPPPLAEQRSPPLAKSDIPALVPTTPELYLALLQQQMDMIRWQMYGNQAAIAPAAEATAPPVVAAQQRGAPPAPPPEPPARCDAATNTTIIEVSVAANARPQDHAPVAAAASALTLGAADLEAALCRVNRTEIERFEQLPPDTGSNYRPFFSQIGLGEEDEVVCKVDLAQVEDEDFAHEEVKGHDEDALPTTETIASHMEIPPQGEGPTAHLVRKVKQILAETNHDLQPGLRVDDIVDENAGLPPANSDAEMDEDPAASASLIIARLARHPEQSFCEIPDMAFDAHDEDAQASPLMMFPQKDVILPSAKVFRTQEHHEEMPAAEPVQEEESSLTVDQEGYSVATLEYLRKYELA
ncbi:hypothetical protein HDU88_001869 [Geranomyces variabilis]|nr:hypothetical protein HDU88_001869 [Geranomyces variabilis]